LNRVTWYYTLEGLLDNSYQDHGDGFYDYVFYTFEAGNYPVPRLKEIRYPVYPARVVTYTRAGEGAANKWEQKDWVTGRVTSIQDSGRDDSDTGTTSYLYQGQGRAVQVTQGAVTTKFLSAGGALGFDSFGRVHRIKSTNASGTLVDYTYSYDKRSNPVGRTDGGPSVVTKHSGMTVFRGLFPTTP